MDWYKNFAKDFLEGTAHMTNEEVGIYKRLLDHQWCRRGYLPTGEAELARMVGLSPQDLDGLCTLQAVLSAKFVRRKRGYTNRRLLRVWREARQVAETKRHAARVRWDAHAMRMQNRCNATRAGARRASTSSTTASKKGSKSKAVKGARAAMENLMPEELASAEFTPVWKEWLAYRREHGWSVKPAWQKKQLAKLAPHGPVTAAAALQQSMEQGWRSVWPEKLEDKNGDHKGPDGLDTRGYDGLF